MEDIDKNGDGFIDLEEYIGEKGKKKTLKFTHRHSGGYLSGFYCFC